MKLETKTKKFRDLDVGDILIIEKHYYLTVFGPHIQLYLVLGTGKTLIHKHRYIKYIDLRDIKNIKKVEKDLEHEKGREEYEVLKQQIRKKITK